MEINGFDCDGVISIGIYPGPNDVIITGRSFEEKPETLVMLRKRGIFNHHIFFNELPFDKKSRETSGIHKGNTLNKLLDNGYTIAKFFEDDEVQIEQIKRIAPWVTIIHVVQDIVPKENMRHLEDL